MGGKVAIWGVLLAAASSGLACSEDDEKKRTETPSGLGRLSQPNGSGPEATPLRLLRYVQLGNMPLAAREYDARVVRVLGSRVIMGALGDQRNSLAVVSPEVVDTEQTEAGGTLVVVNVESKGRPVGRYSFFVGNLGGSWKIRYDTLLGDGLSAYVQSRTQLVIDPEAPEPSARATAAGRRAAERYREVFAPRPLIGSAAAG